MRFLLSASMVSGLLGLMLGCGGTAPIAPSAAPPSAVSAPAQPAEIAEHVEATTGDRSTTGARSPEQGAASPADAPPVDPLPFETLRPPDQRSVHDLARLEARGIRCIESRRLRLYTDLAPEEAQPLPPLVDALFDDWQAYFGALPPARDGSEFQLSGYLMEDPRRFREAGLLPVDLPVFAHGKHQDQQFWMNEQDHPYYRRHLLLHEATHCYMQAMGGTTADVPLWYLEGMAELFATHRLRADGSPEFRVMPDHPEAFVGFGRIEMIDHDVREGEPFTLARLNSCDADRFQQRQSSYAWSWLTCLLADRNPRYRDAFQQLSRRYVTEGFEAAWESSFASLAGEFAAEWTLLARRFDYGHDFVATGLSFPSAEPLTDDRSHQTTVAANRGWQSTGVRLSAGQTYSLTAAGQVTLAAQPRPWVSEPQGVTIRYAQGAPLGQLLAMLVDITPVDPAEVPTLTAAIPIGRSGVITPEDSGTLYLRVNDFDNELADNTGAFAVEIAITPADQ